MEPLDYLNPDLDRFQENINNTIFPNFGITRAYAPPVSREELRSIDRTGIMNNSIIDDAGYQPEYYEEFPERGTFRSGLRSLFDNLQNSRIGNFALSAINPVFGAISGIGSLINRSGFQDFRRSDTLADFFQSIRDRRAREEAAARGAAKQAEIVASQQVDTGGGEGSRPGGFGVGAGDFSPSDPTATEGSF